MTGDDAVEEWRERAETLKKERDALVEDAINTKCDQSPAYKGIVYFLKTARNERDSALEGEREALAQLVVLVNRMNRYWKEVHKVSGDQCNCKIPATGEITDENNCLRCLIFIETDELPQAAKDLQSRLKALEKEHEAHTGKDERGERYHDEQGSWDSRGEFWQAAEDAINKE